MATTHDFYTLSNTVAARLTPVGITSGYDITLQNVNTSGYIYVGGEDVSSTSYGFRISPNQALSVELTGKSTLYAIASAGGLNMAVLKTNLEYGA